MQRLQFRRNPAGQQGLHLFAGFLGGAELTQTGQHGLDMNQGMDLQMALPGLFGQEIGTAAGLVALADIHAAYFDQTHLEPETRSFIGEGPGVDPL